MRLGVAGCWGGKVGVWQHPRLVLVGVLWCPRCPTFPRPCGCSIIGAGRLNYRVRNVTGCTPSAMATEKQENLWWVWGVLGEREQSVRVVVCGVVISASQLNALLRVHVWSIYPVVCWGPEKVYLEAGFALRCFQRLSVPNVANQPCPGRDNWHTSGPSTPVLSY